MKPDFSGNTLVEMTLVLTLLAIVFFYWISDFNRGANKLLGKDNIFLQENQILDINVNDIE